jgi:hypothetical protein
MRRSWKRRRRMCWTRMRENEEKEGTLRRRTRTGRRTQNISIILT